jgi:hypothetical protein
MLLHNILYCVLYLKIQKRIQNFIWKCFEILEKEKEKEFHFPSLFSAQLSRQSTASTRPACLPRARPVFFPLRVPLWAKPSESSRWPSKLARASRLPFPLSRRWRREPTCQGFLLPPHAGVGFLSLLPPTESISEIFLLPYLERLRAIKPRVSRTAASNQSFRSISQAPEMPPRARSPISSPPSASPSRTPLSVAHRGCFFSWWVRLGMLYPLVYFFREVMLCGAR